MHSGRSHFLWVALAAAALAGCHQEVNLFGLVTTPHSGSSDADPGRASIGLTELPGLDDSEEGYLLPESAATPLYTLHETYRSRSAGETWAFTLAGLDRPLSVSVFGESGEVIASRAIRGPIPGAANSVVLVPVPGIADISAFQVFGDVLPSAAANTQTDVRLVGVATSTPGGAPSSGVTEIDGTIVIGHDSLVDLWGVQDGDAVTWSLRPDGEIWNPLSPVEITYQYKATSAPQRGEFPVPPSVQLTVGSQLFSLKVRPGVNRAIIYPNLYATQGSAVMIRSQVDGFDVRRIGPLPGMQLTDPDAPAKPLLADLGTVVDYPMQLWRTEQFELFRWTLFPEILVMDVQDYATQSRFFKRLAFYVEKEDYRGQVLSDAELAGRHGYNAHNYNAVALAAFFNEARSLGVPLTAEEIVLRGILEREGVISRSGERFVPGVGGILSVSQESRQTPGLRALLLTHEAYHGVYYASAEYAQQIHELWVSLSDDQRRFWILLLDAMQYDVVDDYLVENEFHAYLLQQPPDYAEWYFEIRSAQRLRQWKPHEAQWLNKFFAENEDTFTAQAAAANAILFSLTGLVGGDVICLSPIDPTL